MLTIPTQLGGRPVMTRGVHLHPSGNHGDWLREVERWIAYLVSMYISWVVICTDDGAALPGTMTEKGWVPGGGQVDRHWRSAIEALLQAGIIPILRFLPSNLPRPFTPFEWVRVFAELCARYGVPAFVQLANEPRDNREWLSKRAPWDWLEQYSDWFQMTAADCIWPYGAIAVYADAPFLTKNPFTLLHEDTLARFEAGDAVFGGHFYAHNLPYDHPFDDVARLGVGISQAEYEALLGVYAGNPHWQDMTVEQINLVRLAMREPEPDIMDYPVCWNGWQRIAQWMVDTFGRVLPMAMTEGGWTPHARHDERYPYATYDFVAENTLKMLDQELEFNGEPVTMFARCPWLLADELMCGGAAVGWSLEAWIGTCEHGLWGIEKPVMQALIENPPAGLPPVPLPDPDPPGPDSPEDWVMEVVQREPGLGLIIGRLPEAGIPVVVVDPWDNVQFMESGSKPGHGVGGFEAWAPNAGVYRVSFLEEEYEVEVREEETVWVVWDCGFEGF